MRLSIKTYNKNLLKAMKKLFYLMLCMTIGLCATSCLSDDDDNNNTSVLTKAQKEAQLQAMWGTYSGDVFFINDTTNQVDSLPINWQMVPYDSMLVANNFPLKLLAQGITSSEKRNILMQDGYEPLTTIVYPYAISTTTEGLYAFWVIPRDYKMEFSTEYEGENHDVEVEFTDMMTAYSDAYTTSLFYANGMYLQSKMQWYVLVKSVSVDRQKYTTGRAMLITGKKI